ncbi:MAG: response regulator transcription factor [Shinella sp.]|nr:response regulator transcription factor [Shinella sp.]
MAKPTTIVIVDDHALFRLGVVQALAAHETLKIVGEGSCKADAIELAETLDPEIALLDISMPGNGIDAAREIGQRRPAVKIVMLTVSQDGGDVMRALEAGAAGYILKGISASDLASALLSVAAGSTYLAPELGAGLFGAIKSQSGIPQSSDLLPALSDREQEIFRLLGRGFGNRAIAEALGITIRTVKFHVSRMLVKLKAANRVEIALLAQKLCREE